MKEDQELLDVLACEIDKRPKGAPSFFDLSGSLRRIDRDGTSLVLEYERSRVDSVEALVAAEQLCCPEIDWEFERDPLPRVRVTATASQLDVLEASLALAEGSDGTAQHA